MKNASSSQEKKDLSVKVDDLAVPEIQFSTRDAREAEEEAESAIEYGTAVPEIHIRRVGKREKEGKK